MFDLDGIAPKIRALYTTFLNWSQSDADDALTAISSYLDAAISDVITGQAALAAAIAASGDKAPIASGLMGRQVSHANLDDMGSTSWALPVTATETAYNTWKTLLSYTGSGVISLMAVKQTAGGNTSSRDVQLSLQIDGNEVYLSDADLWQTNSTDDNKGVWLVGAPGYLTSRSLGFLPFKTSFTLRFKKTENATGTVGLTGYVQYHKTG